MAMEQDKVLEAIRRCLALSESSNEHEAASAAAKAQELLFKYNLFMAQVEATADSSEKKTKVGEEIYSVITPKNQGRWKATLISRIARYNFCDLVFYGKNRVMIIGKPHNILVVQELYLWIVEQMKDIITKACREYTGYDRIPTFRRSFLESAVMTIGNRLYRQWEESQEESEASTALVVVTGIELADYVAKRFPDLKNARMSRGSGSGDGHQAGREAGERVNLTSQRKLSNE